MKILNFGACNIDYVYNLDHIVKSGETESTGKLEIFPGGKGLNQSVAISRAGREVFHVGCIGKDGEMLVDILNSSGVDTRYIKSVNSKNGHAIIQVDSKGENSIFLYPGSNAMITTDFIDSVLDNFTSKDIILLQNEINNIEYIIRKAYKKGMCIVLNPSPFNEKVSKINLNMISFIILNEVEAKGYSLSDSTEKSLAYFKKNYPNLRVMLTLGGNGCVYTDKNTQLYHPVFEVETVDTTAAGDTFTGYFIAGISKGTNYEDILKFASCASAIAVSRNGAAPSIPTMQEVVDALNYLSVKKNSKSEILQRKIDNYIRDNIKTATLAELADVLGYSSVYTGVLVKKIYKETFTSLLQNERCIFAKKILADTDLPIEEIIRNVGYENESFFRKIFKEKYGKNLLKYRKSIGGIK